MKYYLVGVGDKKVDVIKTVRNFTGLGLKESKEVVDRSANNGGVLLNDYTSGRSLVDMVNTLRAFGATVQKSFF